LLASTGCKANIARAKELIAVPLPAVDLPAANDTADPHATSDHRPPCPAVAAMLIVEVSPAAAHRAARLLAPDSMG
jgi:hypothetical protein